jgi:hypothetical protein
MPQFEIGQTYATPAAAEFLTSNEAARLLHFHTRGYWDEMDSEDILENELSVEKGFREREASSAVKPGGWLSITLLLSQMGVDMLPMK